MKNAPSRTLLLLGALVTVLVASAWGCGGDDTGDAAAEGGGEGAAATEAGRLARMAEQEGGDLIDLSGVGYDLGETSAPLTVVEFSDFGCPYCRRFAEETFPALREEFVAAGKVRWKYVPFVLGKFTNGAEAARAAECAGGQGAFWEMHDRLFRGQGEWKETDDPGALFRRYAGELGLDADRFAACYREGRRGHRTEEANRLAARLGVRATPTFYIDGFPVQGAIPLEPFSRLLRELHAEKEASGR